jgi:predicted nucleic acid-binding protein
MVTMLRDGDGDHAPQVVLDTNVFVGAGFNPRSHSARLIDAVRDGRLHIVWDDATREEIEHVLRRIPRLSWSAVAGLFRDQDRFDGDTHPDQFEYVLDPADRKFAAIAAAASVPLVTSDRGLLNARGRAPFPILKPSEFVLDQ